MYHIGPSKLSYGSLTYVGTNIFLRDTNDDRTAWGINSSLQTFKGLVRVFYFSLYYTLNNNTINNTRLGIRHSIL